MQCMRTVFAGRHDDVVDCSVEVRVDDGRARVGSPEAAERAAQLAVVQLGEAVKKRDAAGLRVIPGGVDAASVEREQLRLAAQRYHPRDQHGACSGGDHVLHRTSARVKMYATPRTPNRRVTAGGDSDFHRVDRKRKRP